MLEKTVQKAGRNKGKKFLGCSNYPRCNNMVWNIPREEKEITRVDMPTNVIGTPQQENFWAAIRDSNQHIILDAKAGTGKTFSIVHAYTFIPSTLRVKFAAFNRHIIAELKTRLPLNADVSTMNSFGSAMVRQWNRKLRFNSDKLDDIMSALIPMPDMPEEDEKAQVLFLRDSVSKIVNFSRYRMVDVKDPNLYDLFDTIADDYDILLNDSANQIFTLAKTALDYCATKLSVFGYDFTDQLWLIWRFNIPVDQYDILFGDEIQDWNPIQWYVAYKAIADHGRFIGVGDVDQSIYGFAGADIDSIPNIVAALENTTRGVIVLPLTYTRRCPKTHVALAQKIVPELESMPEAIEGEVIVNKLENAMLSMQHGDMVICRRNAPLISIAYQLIKQNKSVIVRGRNIGEGMQILISKLKATNIPELIEKAERFREKELDKLAKSKSKAENKIQALNDRIDTLIALTEGKDSIDDLRRYIQDLFTDANEKTSVLLSSVHRSKGLEANTVFIVDYAKIQLKLKNIKLQQQEKHLQYIAETRSKDKLWLVD